MGIRIWLKDRWDRFIVNRSPKTINLGCSILHKFHRLGQFFGFWCGGRFVYVLFFILSLAIFTFLKYLTLSLAEKSWVILDVLLWNVISWYGFAQVILIYITILIFFWLKKYRSILVIEEFTDNTGNDEKNKISGIETYLLVKLNRISQLYMDVDEQRPVSTSVGEFRQLSAVLKTDNPGDMLAKAQSTGSTISFGPITIPVGLFISILNNISQGPRIRGSIRKGKDGYILLATMSGMGRNLSWVVLGSDRLPCEDKRSKIRNLKKTNDAEETQSNRDSDLHELGSVENMVKELAYRIYTDIPSTGSVKWKATYCFNQGLRNYRECLRTPKNQIQNLKDAEHHFQEALACDNTFSTAWYNLGVVYSELNLQNAAEKAFLKSIIENPNEPKAYYALAQSRYEWYFWNNDYKKFDYEKNIIENCNQVHKLGSKLDLPFMKLKYLFRRWEFPDNYSLLAQNLNLKGRTYQEVAFHAVDIGNYSHKKDNIEKAIRNHKKALALAWNNYSKSPEFGIDSDYYAQKKWESSCHLLATCMSDLGWSYLYKYYYGCLSCKRSSSKIGFCTYDKFKKYLVYSEYLFNSALSLNRKLNSDCTCPELNWKLGVVSLIKEIHRKHNNDGKRAKKDNSEEVQNLTFKWFREAAVINPEVMKYHFYLILSALIFNKNEEFDESIGLSKPHVIDLLQCSISSYIAEKEKSDDQWRSIKQVNEIILSQFNEKSNLDLSIVYLFEKIEAFIDIYYDVFEKLNYYQDSDFQETSSDSSCTDIENEYDVLINCMEKVIDSIRGLCGESCLIQKWMRGHVSATKGRLNYYRAINYPELNYCCVDEFYTKSKNYYEEALDYFRQFPKEKEKIYSEIGLVQSIQQSHNFQKALFNITISHQLNPTGDYPHIINGLFSLQIHNYKQALNFFKEALLRAYNISGYSQYIINKYFKKTAYSNIHLADLNLNFEGDDLINPYFDRALDELNRSKKVSTFGYHEELKADEDLYKQLVLFSNPKFEKASYIFSSAIAVYFWKGILFYAKKEFGKAGYYFDIVNSFYQPEIDKIEPVNTDDILWPGKKWPGFGEYIISLGALYESNYELKNYTGAMDCVNKIIGYKELIDSYRNNQMIGKRIWINYHPYYIIAGAYLGKVRLYLDMHINIDSTDGASPEIIELKGNKYLKGSCSFSDCISNAETYITKFKTLLLDIKKQKIQEEEFNEKIEHWIKVSQYELYTCKGLIALEFDKAVPDILPDGKNVQASDPIQHAIDSFKKSIEYFPNSESYVYLLKAYEKKMESRDSSKDEKTSKACVKEAKAYLKALERIDSEKEHQDFIKEYENKLSKILERMKSDQDSVESLIVIREKSKSDSKVK